ncbi:hypothetical protein RND59_07100 [Vibrio ruber]|uniref:tetratricopeptide repeat protein n=1 Tax=Vibrio ruber TaxID=184755 RepID=UPI002893625A|nr:hypothetical protein [Vibrio ruber]WNJ96834.1 hypothetical protein RND59_07100 [Vibrio ruber]
MNINKKLIYKTLLTIVGVIILAVGGLMAYLVIPSGFQSRQAEGPKVLTELLKMAQESQPFNPDPYISSTYRPGDPLYEPLLYIQRHRQGKAEELLQPLVEQGNADAMYWLAQITYDDSYYSSGPAAKLFQKSAELGNPYAALRLDSNNRECQMFMSGYCDQKWGKLGRKLLQERAAQGDKKAEYYLLQYDENSSEEVHKKLEQLVTENAKNHYYQPLMRLIYDYTSRSYLPFFKQDTSLPLEEGKLISHLLKLGANNNFPPSMYYVYSYNNMYNKKYVKQIVNYSISLNLSQYICEAYFSKVSNKSRSDVIKGASCAIANDLNRQDDGRIRVFEFNLSERKINPLTDKELEESSKMAERIIRNMNPVIYIDEMNPRP